MISDKSASSIKIRLLCLALLVVALDQWSKWLIERELDRFEAIRVIPDLFTITHVQNTGIAFGLFPSHGSVAGSALLAVLGLCALGVVSYYFWLASRQHVLLLCALSLVMGGAIGNLIDRVLLGAVTDFFDFYVGTHHWPTFNVADSAICVGIGLLAIETLLPHRAQTPALSPDADSAGPALGRDPVSTDQ